MTDKELVEEYLKNLDECRTKDLMRDACLAGIEIGRPKRHDLRKNPGDLPETLHPVYAKLDSGTYVFAYCVNGIWHRNDDGIILYHGDGKSKVIAWYEIPKFEEV